VDSQVVVAGSVAPGSRPMVRLAPLEWPAVAAAAAVQAVAAPSQKPPRAFRIMLRVPPAVEGVAAVLLEAAERPVKAVAERSAFSCSMERRPSWTISSSSEPVATEGPAATGALVELEAGERQEGAASCLAAAQPVTVVTEEMGVTEAVVVVAREDPLWAFTPTSAETMVR